MEPQIPDSTHVQLNDTDRRHLARIAMLHYLAGAFFLLAGLIFLAAIGLGVWVLVARPPEADTPEMMSASRLLIGLSAIMLIGCWVPGVMLILLGWLLGHCKAYRLCMWLTGVQSVILFPIGPILGVYTYKVANRPAVKAKFTHQADTSLLS